MTHNSGPTKAWSQGIADCKVITAKRDRCFRTAMRRGEKLARKAHPETGGNETLCHNWGNDESRRLWAQTWDRFHKYSTVSDARWHARIDRMRAEDSAEQNR